MTVKTETETARILALDERIIDPRFATFTRRAGGVAPGEVLAACWHRRPEQRRDESARMARVAAEMLDDSFPIGTELHTALLRERVHIQAASKCTCDEYPDFEWGHTNLKHVGRIPFVGTPRRPRSFVCELSTGHRVVAMFPHNRYLNKGTVLAILSHDGTTVHTDEGTEVIADGVSFPALCAWLVREARRASDRADSLLVESKLSSGGDPLLSRTSIVDRPLYIVTELRSRADDLRNYAVQIMRFAQVETVPLGTPAGRSRWVRLCREHAPVDAKQHHDISLGDAVIATAVDAEQRTIAVLVAGSTPVLSD